MTRSRKSRLHLFAGSSLGLWRVLLSEHGGAQRPYRGRLAGILAMSMLTAPLRGAERLCYGRQVARTEIARSPVFIVGFHCSGTTMKFYRAGAPSYRLQDMDWGDIESAVLGYYVTMMSRYLHERESIPRGNLVEVRFEDLEADAMGVLKRVYAELSLPDWERSRAPIAEYLETLSGYRKNVYRFDRALIDTVNREWGFAVREWGYSPPPGG